MTRRQVVAGALVALILPVPAATADDTLEDWLEQGATAEFRGTGMVTCTWGGESVTASYEVTRHAGITLNSGPGGAVMAGGGATAMRSGDDWFGVDFAARADWSMTDRYRLGTGDPTVRFGRPATQFVVFEGDLPRVRMIVDDATAVPLVTEVLDAGGAVFRVAVVVDLEVAGGADMTAPEAMPVRHVAGIDAVPTLPDDLAGYRRVDTYAVAGGGVHAYYADGLFSFSVFENRRGATPEPFRHAGLLVVGGARYRRVITPTEVWVYWNAPDRSYVLVGDLPPDHLAAALGELPRPGDRALLVRLWRRLFG